MRSVVERSAARSAVRDSGHAPVAHRDGALTGSSAGGMLAVGDAACCVWRRLSHLLIRPPTKICWRRTRSHCRLRERDG
ncbi:MAG: hypothetical protein AVDCRST_MAG69-554 [uncultured Solirubrobacteraceae bacterium]|uniref:Uncharacterized protein n=1 Tax=uncultured Solirubrobacteraceae bacterium TaxID=1162706 RepID=A0A6J4RND2_9ACTN|nr:MAG: hypothetical protein AVDCRST_MAG69-554 [uncultured Solirubrobacteraceae bacterium]